MTVIKFENVSKKYKLYSKGGLYLRDRITHALQRLNPFNGTKAALNPEPSTLGAPATSKSHPLALGSQHTLERDFWALRNVSFEIKAGESVGFIGRNGAGKSTILKLLAGVTKPSTGNIEVNGRVAALIEVGAGFHPELTGRDNIYLNGSILGMKKVEIERCFDSIVSFAELEQFIDTPVKHYSSGMYVRLGFAIAAHTNPDIYLIDEVLAVGDEAFQKKCLDTLAAHKAAGKTIILVSHNLEKVAEVCDRCIYVDHGTIVFDGPPAAAVRHYRTGLQKKPQVQRGDGRISELGEILEVILRDSVGKECTSFRTGEDLIIEIRYSTTALIQKPVFGIAIHASNGVQISGLNTCSNSFSIESIEGDGVIACRLKKFPLRTGTYYLSVAMQNDQFEFYDHHVKRYPFEARCDTEFTEGLIFPEVEWTRLRGIGNGAVENVLSLRVKKELIRGEK